MILVPKKRAVLVAPKHPKAVQKLIPTSKIVFYQGRQVLAVPHRLDETRVLNNLGQKVPSPMLTTYDWPRSAKIKKPFEAQKLTAGFLTLNPRAFVLNDLGTGKTLSALWAYDYLRRNKRAKKLLIACPLSTIERAWGDELFFHLPHLKYAVLYGTAARRKKMLDLDVDVYIINHHGMGIIKDELSKREDITHIVIDEVAIARNKTTGLWKSFNSAINGKIKRAAWGMTATPTPNAPTDAYAQVKLINPINAPMYYTAFKQQVMRQVSQFLWVPKDTAVQSVSDIMSPAIRFHMAQCTDLPKTIYITRTAPIAPSAEKVYKAMAKDLAAQVDRGEVLAVNEAVKASKLVQIACGSVYDKDGKELRVDSSPRMELVLELIGQSTSKSIVFVPFVSSVRKVADYITSKGYKVGVVYGGVPKKERDDIFNNFQNGSGIDVIVAQPECMSHGLTLTAASTTIWYAPTTKAEVYEQANGRTPRPGQQHTTLIINIEGTPIERRIYHRLNNKQAMQNLLLETKVQKTKAA